MSNEATTHEAAATKEATRRLLYWARDLASYDEVKPGHGVYDTMQHVAQALTGLKSALKNYDETMAYFSKPQSIAPPCPDCDGQEGEP